MRKKVIYIAGPYRASKQYMQFNRIMWMREFGILIWQDGGVPIVPLLNTFGMDGVLTHDQFIEGDLEIVRRCDALLLIGDWHFSAGCRLERDAAIEAGLPIFTTMAQVRDFIRKEEKE